MSTRSAALISGAGLGGMATAACLTTERILKEMGLARSVLASTLRLNRAGPS